MSALGDLQQFDQFVRQRLSANDEESIGLSELMNEWQLGNPTDEQTSEDVAAVRAAIEDFQNGDRGQAAGELSRKLRTAFRNSKE